MPRRPSALAAVPSPDSPTVTWSAATEAFLRRDLSPGSRRVYKLTLDRVGGHLDDLCLRTLTPRSLGAAVAASYPAASPASWNRHVATLRSFTAFATRQQWIKEDPTTALERRRVPEDHSKALTREHLDALFSRRDIPVRERCLWRMLYETAARSNEILQINIGDLNLGERRATVRSKGGNTDLVHWATGTARLLPKLIGDRTRGPVFLTDRAPVPSRAPALADLDPSTGRARLSYRRAAELFTMASDGATLHQLRHSALTHLAESDVPTILLMAKSRHQSLRTLQRYARPGVEAVAKLTADHDPARRR